MLNYRCSFSCSSTIFLSYPSSLAAVLNAIEAIGSWGSLGGCIKSCWFLPSSPIDTIDFPSSTLFVLLGATERDSSFRRANGARIPSLPPRRAPVTDSASSSSRMLLTLNSSRLGRGWVSFHLSVAAGLGFGGFFCSLKKSSNVVTSFLLSLWISNMFCLGFSCAETDGAMLFSILLTESLLRRDLGRVEAAGRETEGV